MNDLYLKFADKAQADSVLYTTTPVLAVVDMEGNVITPAGEDIVTPNFANIDIIGIIYKPTGAVETINGMEVPVMADVGGWHVNVRNFSPAPELDAYVVVPIHQYRTWAGG